MPTLDTSGELKDDVLFDGVSQWQVDGMNDGEDVFQIFKVSVENAGVEILRDVLIVDNL